MTRKDFQDLAEVVLELDLGEEKREETAERLATFCAQRNPLFNREKFLEACGVFKD